MTKQNKALVSRKETWKHKDVFETYFMLGPSRSFADLADLTGMNAGTLSAWARIFGWQDRLVKRDEETLTKVSRFNDKVYIEQVKVRHQAAYQKVITKALKELSKKTSKWESDKDAAIALDIGVKGEREVLGLRGTTIKGAIVREGFAAMVEAVMNE